MYDALMSVVIVFILTVRSICCCICNPCCWCYYPDIECSTSGKQLMWVMFYFALWWLIFHGTFLISVFSLFEQGGHIIFFQSLSLLGYCLFPLAIGALICMLEGNVIIKIVVVSITLAWSCWAAYPFMSAAVNPRRKALALYPVFLMYISVAFFIIAID